MDELIHSVTGLLNTVIKIFYLVLAVTFLLVIPIDMVNDDWDYYKISSECSSEIAGLRPADSNIESIEDHLTWVRSRHNTYGYNRDAALASDLTALKKARGKRATLITKIERVCHNTHDSRHINEYDLVTYYWSKHNLGYYFNPHFIFVFIAVSVAAVVGVNLPATRN